MTWATSVPILVFLGLSVLDLGPMYATYTDRHTDRQTDIEQHHRLMHPPSGAGITDDVLITERKLFSSSFLIVDFFAENTAKLHISDTILTLIIVQGRP